MKWLAGIGFLMLSMPIAFIIFISQPTDLVNSCVENALTPIPTVTLTATQATYAEQVISAASGTPSASESAVLLTMAAYATDLQPTTRVNPLTGERPSASLVDAVADTHNRLTKVNAWATQPPVDTAALLLEVPASELDDAWDTAYAALYGISEPGASLVDAITRTGSVCGTALNANFDPSQVVLIDGYTSPLPGATITSGFGYRIHPVYGYRKLHAGIDLGYGRGATCNQPILAAADGDVVFAGASAGYGHVIMINHDNGVQTRYAHMYDEGVLVAQGQHVLAGQVIALVGSDGTSTACHLHFETYLPSGQVTNPLALMPWLGTNN